MKENDENMSNHLSNGLAQLVEEPGVLNENFTDSIDSDYITNLDILSEDVLEPNKNESNSMIRYENLTSQQHGDNSDSELNNNIIIANYEGIYKFSKNMIDHNENGVDDIHNEDIKFNDGNEEL